MPLSLLPSKLSVVRFLATVLLVFCGIHLSGVFCGLQACAAQDGTKPNVILINVDDLDYDLWRRGQASGVFPNLERLAREGITFSNCHVTCPLCGPSRASLLTGRYLFNHGVKVHEPSDPVSNGYEGGFRKYVARDSEVQYATNKPNWSDNDISVWMKQSGYHTMMVGKYLHGGFAPESGELWTSLRPSGWDDFYASLGAFYFKTNRYLSRRGQQYQEVIQNTGELNLNDYPAQYRTHLQTRYRTNIEAIDSMVLIDQHRTNQPQQPFFLYLAPFAPHRPSSGDMVDRRYANWWTQIRQPHQVDFDLADVSAKPQAINRLGRLSDQRAIEGDQDYRERLLAMKSFDDMLGVLWQHLVQNEIDQQTLIIFTSDNGYMLGQQRHFGKQLPYDRCTQVPMVVWGPGVGVGANQSRGHLLSHVDVASTILEMTGSPIMPTDGQSFASLLAEEVQIDEPSWRPSGVLTEHYQKIGHAWQKVEGVYASVRMHDQRFTRWADGFSEYYELGQDPFELYNRQSQLSNGDKNLFELLLGQFRASDQPYGGSIAVPGINGERVFRRMNFTGYAESSDGVNDVRLVVSRRLDGQELEYFDGTNWVSGFRQLSTQLEAIGKSLTRWEYDFFPNDQGEYRVNVTARVYSAKGGYQTNVFHRWLYLENEAPMTSITLPATANAVVNRKFDLALGGWAKGLVGIREVRVVIRDRDTNQYFDGVGWTTSYRYVLATLETPNEATYRLWSYQLPSDNAAKRLVASARAVQVDGKADLTVPLAWIEQK